MDNDKGRALFIGLSEWTYIMSNTWPLIFTCVWWHISISNSDYLLIVECWQIRLILNEILSRNDAQQLCKCN